MRSSLLVPAGAAALAAAAVVAGTASPAAATVLREPAVVAAPTTLPDHLRGVHDARQLVVVTAPDDRTSHATVRVFRHRSDGWHRVMGPWAAHVGSHGFAPRGAKREGDLQTPTGSFRMPFAFGVDADPGSRLHYRRALSSSRWDDDSTSANYNRWVDIRRGNPGSNPEHMRVLPVYRYGVVIGYNTARRPWRGSAIFFHVTDGRATTGCVSVSKHRVVRLLRWLRPALHPRFVMGTPAAITR